MPDFPASRFFQLDFRFNPTGLTMPIPVITTRFEFKTIAPYDCSDTCEVIGEGGMPEVGMMLNSVKL
jgi:hypothetical protein